MRVVLYMILYDKHQYLLWLNKLLPFEFFILKCVFIKICKWILDIIFNKKKTNISQSLYFNQFINLLYNFSGYVTSLYVEIIDLCVLVLYQFLWLDFIVSIKFHNCLKKRVLNSKFIKLLLCWADNSCQT